MPFSSLQSYKMYSPRSSAMFSRSTNNKRMKKNKRSWLSSFGYSLSPQDLIMVCAALVVLYLMTGESAELVCDTFTSLPPAVFTYQLLTDAKATKIAYEATLCFWILHGTLVVFDHLLHKTVWYFLAKFLLMSAVSTHVLSKCKQNDASENVEEVEERNENVRDIPLQSSTSLSSAMADESSTLTAATQHRFNGAKKRKARPSRFRNIHKSQHVPLCHHHRHQHCGVTVAERRTYAGDDSLVVQRSALQQSTPVISPDAAMRTQSGQRTQFFNSLSEKFTPPEKTGFTETSDQTCTKEVKKISKGIQTSSSFSSFTPFGRILRNDDIACVSEQHSPSNDGDGSIMVDNFSKKYNFAPVPEVQDEEDEKSDYFELNYDGTLDCAQFVGKEGEMETSSTTEADITCKKEESLNASFLHSHHQRRNRGDGFKSSTFHASAANDRYLVRCSVHVD